MNARQALFALLVCVAASANAAPTVTDAPLDAGVDDALALLAPGETPAAAASGPATRIVQFGVEAGLGYDRWNPAIMQDAAPANMRERVSATAYLDQRFGRYAHLVFADRIDVAWRGGDGGLESDDVAHTLKEAALSVGGREWFVDVGRFNERIGVAYAFNPTDFGRRYTIVAKPSEDPALVRGDRLGKIGLRSQWLWRDGSVLLGFSPRLRRTPSAGMLSAYVERSNSDDELWLRIGQRVGKATQLEAVAYCTTATRCAGGTNVSALIGDRLVLFGEALVTREADLVDRALALDPARPFALAELKGPARPRVAIGGSYSPTSKFTAVLEWDHDGTAPGGREWRRFANPVTADDWRRYIAVRRFTLISQDNLSRDYAFVHVSVREPFGADTGITAFSRINLADHSAYFWLQATRDFDGFSAALTLTRCAGRSGTEFGTVNSPDSIQLVISKAL